KGNRPARSSRSRWQTPQAETATTTVLPVGSGIRSAEVSWTSGVSQPTSVNRARSPWTRMRRSLYRTLAARPLAQHVLEHLAGRVDGQRVHDLDAAGDLVVGHALLAPGDELALRECRAGTEDDER